MNENSKKFGWQVKKMRKIGRKWEKNRVKWVKMKKIRRKWGQIS